MKKITIDAADEVVASMKHALGPVADLLENPEITDIMYNSNRSEVFYDGAMGKQYTDWQYPASQALNFVNIAASYDGRQIKRGNADLAVQLPEELFSCRLQAYVKDITPGVSFALRKPGKLYPIESYVDQRVKRILSFALENKKTMLVCGSTGAGKTSFLNALVNLLGQVRERDRLNIVEDTPEIECNMINYEHYRVTRNTDGNIITSIADNVENCLRNNPDWIIIGEVRNKATAGQVIEAWESGHPGFCTVHAKNATVGYSRFRRLAGKKKTPEDQQEITNVIDFVLYLEKINGQRAVRQVIRPVFDPTKENSYVSFDWIYGKPKPQIKTSDYENI